MISNGTVAEKSWRRLDGHDELPKAVLADGVEVVRSRRKALPPTSSVASIRQ